MIPLPEELLERICWNLAPGSSRVLGKAYVAKKRALYSLMRVSKAFYRAARPVLYHTLTVGSDAWDIGLCHLLHLCTKYPDTPKLVRELHLGYWETDEQYWEYNAEPAYDVETLDMDPLLTVTRTLGVSAALCADIRSSLREGSADAMTTLLLGLCIQLESLSAKPNTFEGTLAIRLVEEAVLRSTSTGRSPLQFLRYFHTEHWDTENGVRLSKVMPFLHLPSLETFAGNQTIIEQDDSLVPLTSRLSLRHLDISDSSIDAENLERLLTVSPGLCELDIELGETLVSAFEPNIGEFGDVLRRCGSRIERLKFEMYESWEINADDFGLENIASMRMLRTLHLSWHTLFGDGYSENDWSFFPGAPGAPEYLVDILPDSLEDLQISTTPDMYEFASHLDAQFLAMMTSEKFANLSSIAVMRSEPFTLQLPPGWVGTAPDTEPIMAGSDSIHYRLNGGIMGYSKGWMRLERTIEPSHHVAGSPAIT